MKLRSLILVALIGGLFFGRIRESHAITTCNVCADGEHPCNFPCYTGSPPSAFATTCKLAGYSCFRVPHASRAACDLPLPAAMSWDLATLVTDWLRDGIAFVSNVAYRVAALDPGTVTTRPS